jgi:hypothetical protein
MLSVEKSAVILSVVLLNVVAPLRVIKDNYFSLACLNYAVNRLANFNHRGPIL